MKKYDTLLQELYFLNEIYLSKDNLKPPSYMYNIMNNDENRKMFDSLKNQNNVLFAFSQSPKIEVTYTVDGKYLLINALDYSISRITFYAELELGKIDPNDYNLKTHSKYSALPYVCVRKIYRDRSFKSTMGLPEKFYMDYLINKYGTLFSDHEQSNDGKNYWMKLIPKFFANKLHVYVFNYGDPGMPNAPMEYPKAYGSTQYSHGDAIRFSSAVEFTSFLEQNKIWGDSNSEYQNIRIVVTKYKLF